MIKQPRLLLLADISNLASKFYNELILNPSEIRIKKDEVVYFFDWCVNQTLVIDFNMRVAHHYRNDVYLCRYSEIEYPFKLSFRSCVSTNDLDLFRGNEVKTLVNGRDLYITRSESYMHFIPNLGIL